MEKIVKSKEVEELVLQTREIEEFFEYMIDQLRKMDSMAFELRQKINHESHEKTTKPEKTLLIGQLRMLNNSIDQIKETINYFKNDKVAEISDKIYDLEKNGGK